MRAKKTYDNNNDLLAQQKKFWEDRGNEWNIYSMFKHQGDEQDDADDDNDGPTRLQEKVADIILRSIEVIYTYYQDQPTLILLINRKYLRRKRMWKYFSEYMLNQGAGKLNEETGTRTAYTYEERYKAGRIEGEMYFVYGLPKAKPGDLKGGSGEASSVSADKMQPVQVTSLETEKSAEEIEIEKILENTNISWSYTEVTKLTREEQVERDWVRTYSAYEDPEYGKDIELYKELTAEQKEKYKWDEVKKAFKADKGNAGVPDKTLNQWIRKNLMNGWTLQDMPDVPQLNEIKVKFDQKTGEPIIQAASFTDAWKEAGRIGLAKNSGKTFVWERKISGKRTRHGYTFAPPDVYYNRITLKADQKKTYVDNMFEILGNADMKKDVMAEDGFEDEFALMVRQTQAFLNLKVDGKMTPETIQKIADRAAKLRKDKKDKAAYEAKLKETYEVASFIPVGKEDRIKGSLYNYKYHNTILKKGLYIRKAQVDKVSYLARNGGDMDSPTQDLTDDEMFRLDIDVRKICINNIASGYTVVWEDEETIVRLFENTPPHQYKEMKEWIPKMPSRIKREVEHDDLRRRLNDVLANEFGHMDRQDFNEMKTEVKADSYSADSKVYQMSDKSLKNLEYYNKEYNHQGYKAGNPSLRIQSLKVVANGYAVGDEDEESLIRLLTVLPDEEKVARQVRTAIAHELLKKQHIYIDGEYIEVDFALLRQIHDATHGGEYPKLRKALDKIFKENGFDFAAKIKSKLDNSKSSTAHIEYFGEYGSKEAYKYLGNEDKIKFIKQIQAGDWEGDTDEQTIIEIMESVGMPLSKVNQKDPKAIQAAADEEKRLKQDFYNKLKAGTYGITIKSLEDSFHGEEHTTMRRLLSEMDVAGSAGRIKTADNNKLSNSTRRDEIRYMSDADFKKLKLEQRKKYIELLVEMNSSGWTQFWTWTGDAAESAIVKIITFTPKDQATDFSDWLYSKAGHYNTLHSAIDGSEYNQFHDAMNTLAETKKQEKALPSAKLTEIETLRAQLKKDPDNEDLQKKLKTLLNQVHTNKQKVEGEQQKIIDDLDINKMQHKNTLPWGSGKTQDGKKEYSYSYTAEMVDHKGDGAWVHIDKIEQVTEGDETKTTITPLKFKPDEAIGVYFLTELEGVGKENEFQQMLAVNFFRVLNEEFKKQIWELVEFAAILLSFMPLLRLGISGLARILAYADAIITVLSSIISHNKDLLPAWFTEAFFYVEQASLIFAFIGNPKKIAEAEKALTKMDDGIKTLKSLKDLPQGFDESARYMREVMEEELSLIKTIDNADEATLRKMIKELEVSNLKKAPNEGLLMALNKRLLQVSGDIAKSSDEAMDIQRKTADALYNKSQGSVLDRKKAQMAEIVEERKVKQGSIIPDGNKLILRDETDNVLASPVFNSRKEMAAWKQHTTAVKPYLDPLDAAPDPVMHPWFYRDGKLLQPQTHPHLYDGSRPLTMAELFGPAGKFNPANEKKFNLLQELGDFQPVGLSKAEDIAAFGRKADEVAGTQMDAKTFRELVTTEAGVAIEVADDAALNEMLRKGRLYAPDPTATRTQQEFTNQVMSKHLANQVDDDMAGRLMTFAKQNPESQMAIDELIERFETIRQIEYRVDRAELKINKAKKGYKEAAQELKTLVSGQMYSGLNPEIAIALYKMAYYKIKEGAASIETFILEAKKILQVEDLKAADQKTLESIYKKAGADVQQDLNKAEGELVEVSNNATVQNGKKTTPGDPIPEVKIQPTIDLTKFEPGPPVIYAPNGKRYSNINGEFHVWDGTRWVPVTEGDDIAELTKLGYAVKKSGDEVIQHGDDIAKGESKKIPGTASKVTQVAHGSTDLSKMSIDYRIQNNISSARNVAVVEYEIDGVKKYLFAVSERGKGHAERLAAKELEALGIKPAQVKRLYTELEPCMSPGGYCKRFLEKTYPDTEVTYSFEYGLTKESKTKGLDDLRDAINNKINIPFDPKKFVPETPVHLVGTKRYTNRGGKYYIWDDSKAEWSEISKVDYDKAVNEQNLMQGGADLNKQTDENLPKNDAEINNTDKSIPNQKENNLSIQVNFSKGSKTITFDKEGNMLVDGIKPSKNLKENVFKSLELSHAVKGHGPERISKDVANEAYTSYLKDKRAGFSGKFSSDNIMLEAFEMGKKELIDPQTGKLLDINNITITIDPRKDWPEDWAEVYMVNEKVKPGSPVIEKDIFGLPVTKVKPNKIQIVYNKNSKFITIYPIYEP